MPKEKQESQTVEFKESWNDDYIRNISAFANSKGGVLDIGVRDDGKVVGITPTPVIPPVVPSGSTTFDKRQPTYFSKTNCGSISGSIESIP